MRIIGVAALGLAAAALVLVVMLVYSMPDLRSEIQREPETALAAIPALASTTFAAVLGAIALRTKRGRLALALAVVF